MEDEAVMLTNDDASNCKRYAVHKGYWHDSFIQYFVKGIPSRKTPEINRGYFIRFQSVRNLVEQFLEKTNKDCQIINLGAGFDTLYWNLYEANKVPKFGVYEIDMKQNVQRKCMSIHSKLQLKSCLSGKIDISRFHVDSDYYHLMAADLRNVEDINNKLMAANMQKNTPTLFIFECVFVYLSYANSQKILEYIANDFTSVMVIDYDPVNFNDRFGEVMKQNLRGRQCHLLGAQPDLISKKNSYSMFTSVKVKLLVDIYNDISTKEKERVESIEFLDEVDLLIDLLKHYCICCAYKDNVIGLDQITL